MASVNKVILVGNLGKDPEVRYMPNGDAVANFSIATTDTWKDKNGMRQERTEWHNISMYRRLAEIAGEYLKKGSSVYVEGRLQTRKWQDKNGQDRYTTEIICDQMQMLGSKNGGTSNYDSTPSGGQQGNQGNYGRQTALQQDDGGYTRDDSPPPPPVRRAPQQAAPRVEDMDDDIPF